MRKKWIHLPFGECGKLATDFKVTKAMVSNALGFKTDSNLAKLLRKAALERGGKLIEIN